MKETYYIENIKCGGCSSTIHNAAMQVEGVLSAKVDIENQSVEIESETAQAIATVLEKLDKLGYPVAGHNNVLKKAKSYVSCAIGRIDGDKND